jgi:antitoxin component YwqK of YwqJK toxin-antitoxin module
MWYPDGTQLSRKNFDDLEEQSFYPSGNIKYNRTPSVIETWYDNGSQKSYETGFQKNDYYDNGQVASKIDGDGINFHRDFWYPDGTYKGFCKYNNYRVEGIYTEYHPSGITSLKTTYRHGVEEGIHEEWWDNGNPRLSYNCIEGVMNGLYQEWDYDGNTIVKKFVSKDDIIWGSPEPSTLEADNIY